jgi:hypothetical protein
MADAAEDVGRPKRRTGVYRMRTPAVAVASTALVATACVATERSAFVKAREAHRECVEAHPDDRETCDHLEAESNRSAQEYGDQAARSWGCTHTPNRCDEPRR